MYTILRFLFLYYYLLYTFYFFIKKQRNKKNIEYKNEFISLKNILKRYVVNINVFS